MQCDCEIKLVIFYSFICSKAGMWTNWGRVKKRRSKKRCCWAIRTHVINAKVNNSNECCFDFNGNGYAEKNITEKHFNFGKRMQWRDCFFFIVFHERILFKAVWLWTYFFVHFLELDKIANRQTLHWFCIPI